MKKEIKVAKVQTTKKCITCGKRKKIAAFAVRSDNGKLRGACKACIVEKAKALRASKK